MEEFYLEYEPFLVGIIVSFLLAISITLNAYGPKIKKLYLIADDLKKFNRILESTRNYKGKKDGSSIFFITYFVPSPKKAPYLYANKEFLKQYEIVRAWRRAYNFVLSLVGVLLAFVVILNILYN